MPLDKYLWRMIFRIVLLIVSPIPIILVLWYYLDLSDTFTLQWCIVTALGNLLLFVIAPLFVMWDMGKGYGRIRPDPNLQRMAEELARRMNTPVPEVFLKNDQRANACTIGYGKKHRIIVNSGLVSLLYPEEVRAVMAHEMAHIRHRDAVITSLAMAIRLVMTVIAYLIGILVVIFVIILLSSDKKGPAVNVGPLFWLVNVITLFLFPMFLMVWTQAISRDMEYDADAEAAEAVGNGRFLSSALRKLEGLDRNSRIEAQSGYQTAFNFHHFTERGFAGVFSSHPSTEDRIKRLERHTWPAPYPNAVPNPLSAAKSFVADDPLGDLEQRARAMAASGNVPIAYCSSCGRRLNVLCSDGRLVQFCDRCGKPMTANEMEIALRPR